MSGLLIVGGVFAVIVIMIAFFVAQQMDNVEKVNLTRKPKTLSDKLRESGLAPLETDRFREIVMSGDTGNEVESLLQQGEGAGAGVETPEDIALKNVEAFGHRINVEGKDLQTLYAEYLSAKNLNPFDVEPEFTLGVAYMRFGQYDKAQNQFQKVIDMKPDFEGIYYYLGESMRCNGQFYEAMIAYKKSWEMDKKLSESRAAESKLPGSQPQIPSK